VKSIQPWAFYNCTSLKKVYSLIEQPYAINENVFQYKDYNDNNTYKFTSATLYVPKGTKSKYQATEGWKNFTKIIEMSDKPGDANNDSAIDVRDMSVILQAILDGTTASLPPCADVTGDGVIDVRDMSAILNMILGK